MVLARDLEASKRDFEEVADTLFAHRFNGHVFRKSDDYQEKSKILEGLINDIRELLPDDQKHLLNKYDDTVASMEAITEEFAYKAGFMDAMVMLYQIRTEPKVGEDT
ncbi:hypothetical protein [Brevibacillus brevis]|uniref:hypothetical protein n=1 Tax=Brevibacillus brevis TaxID=1393 RepID=UPI0011575E60|nr:hypothetical protein [Lysinibacillus sp. SDF0063]TQR33990.1 hypothetical protein C7Y45_18520 [Lysinibacillus sp. SDF0063]